MAISQARERTKHTILVNAQYSYFPFVKIQYNDFSEKMKDQTRKPTIHHYLNAPVMTFLVNQHHHHSHHRHLATFVGGHKSKVATD